MMGDANGFYMKPWEELTFTDDYMFKLILRKHEDICRRILETILEVKIGRIEYLETEKVSEPGYEGHGVRFDVYLRDDTNTVYNIEMQVRNPGDTEIAKRMRYYQAAIDVENLPAGGRYGLLCNSFMIFICPFEFLQGERVLYTFRNRCVQDTDIQLPDETTKIVIATKGRITADIPRALIPLISYINNQEIQDELTQSLDNVIEYEKRFEKERVGYMNLKLTLSEERAYGYDLGLADGVLKGKQEGKIEGKIEGERKGKLDALRTMISAGLTTLAAVQQSGLYTPEELSAIQDAK